MKHLVAAWAALQRQGAFLEPPKDRLYPCVWTEDNGLRPEARRAFESHVYGILEPTFPDAREFVRLAIIGSGACYNWSEAGDLDVQLWVADEERLPAVRRLVIDQMNGFTCADFGLATDDCDGAMEVQFYAKPGFGSPRENREGQPYACFDLGSQDEGYGWVVEPYPMPPEMYANQFLLVAPRAEEVAAEAEALVARYERTRRNADYWAALAALTPGYEERATEAQLAMREAHTAVREFFRQFSGDRMGAYGPEGFGIHDERDAIWKLLEVWGLTKRVKTIAQGKPGVTA